MLRNTEAIATLAVKNLKAAAAFYEDKVGLERGPGNESQVITYKSGSSKLLVYESQYAGTNKATAVTWAVDDVAGVVDRLKAKGVKFERYDFPGVRHEGDVHVMGDRKNAWLMDPDGNILSIVNKQ
jgi:extradiol dioxygenase family protein